jgi:perosamine synthetase
LTPSFTFIASANSSLFVGARPVFCDIEGETYGLDVYSVRSLVTKDTKMIMPVHVGGLVAKDTAALKELAAQRGILLVEDACEALGSMARGVKAGTFGDVAVFSFCGNKVITTGEGGMVVTNSGEIYEKLKLYRSHGRLEKEPYFLTTKSLDYIDIGYNWRMPTIVAALGIAQMSKLERVIEKRREIAARMSEDLSKIPEVQTPVEPSGFRHIYQMYTIRVKTGRRKREGLREFLTKKGIITKVFFEPVHLSYLYRERYGHHSGELPTTERISGEVLTLPIYPTMTEEEVSYVTDSVRQFFRPQ